LLLATIFKSQLCFFNKGLVTGPFCTPKPDADLCLRVDLPLDKKTVENQDWATGPPGSRATGPSWAVGRGPLGRRGPALSKTLLMT